MKSLILLIAAASVLSGCAVYATPYESGRPPSHRGSGDRDRDGIPDRVDRDRDGDGVRNRQDSRPNNPNRY